MEKPISFSIPGALQILVERRKGVFEQFSNIDGLRIDRDQKEIHYVFFNGKTWEKAVLCDAELAAARSIRDSKCFFNSYTIEYFYTGTETDLIIVGIKIVSEDTSNQCFETHYMVGQTTGDNLLAEKQYFNAGIKSLQDVVKICKDELKHKAVQQTMNLSLLLSAIGTLTKMSGET